MMFFTLRPAEPEDFPTLSEVWERSVRATHCFLTEMDVLSLKPQVGKYLEAVDVTVAFAATGETVGFIGVSGASPKRVEMLFVDPAFFRRGVGRLLLTHVLRDGSAELDVNEQNPEALRFYEAFGFVVSGRSPLDGEGRPFPLLHLRLAPGSKAGYEE